MAIKAKEVRQLSDKERAERLNEARRDLMHERGVAAMGGAPANPGKIRDLRTAIARILTVQDEQKKAQPAATKQARRR